MTSCNKSSDTHDVPVFAVLGHPNEGKSSVVATLAENDTVPISPTPGETRQCHQYPVIIDGREIIRFVDTPGFQNPRETHRWAVKHAETQKPWICDFISSHKNDPEFSDECQLFAPLADGAGVIFVVDGTRPVRSTDRIEMEILRLTGAARMAVINTKDKEKSDYLEDWKNAARMHFNTIRIFDAHRTSFSGRMGLLESLKAIDPDWQQSLQTVIDAFEKDWQQRLAESAAIISNLLVSVINHRVKKTVKQVSETEAAEKKLISLFENQIADMEKKAHEKIKKLFKHNIFSYDLPPRSLAGQDLFSKRTLKALGLTRNQLTWAGAGLGAGIGAHADLALAGLSFGVFTAIGGALGAGSAAWGTRKIARTKIKGQTLGGISIQAGPVQNDRLLYVLIDRCLIYFWHVTNWAHSRRDKPEPGKGADDKVLPFLTAKWDEKQKKITLGFFAAARKNDPPAMEPAARDFRKLLENQLKRVSST
jgi:hypothetical protein